jgi:capsular polysaccharide biosynthesis protein
VTDPVIFSLSEGSSEPDRLGAYYDFASSENRSADFAPGLVSLGFIMAALRRSARLLCVLTIVGLVLGVGSYKARPHPFQASATVLLTLSAYENSLSAPADDTAIAETRAVAGLAVQEFKLNQSVSSLLTSYTVASPTDRVLLVTASAPSADLAVLRANAVASAFLKFRASELQDQQNLIQQSLDQQVNAAKRQVNSIDAQISQLSSQASSPSQQAQLSKLAAEQKLDNDTLGTEETAATANQTTVLAALTAALKNSQILSVVPLPHSKLKPLITYAVLGLIAGFAIGFAIIVVRALTSDRLRRRDDIAYTIDAPVRLSVGRLHARPWQIRRKARRDHDMKRLIAHLQSAVPRNTKGPAGLAIVAVDNAPVVARGGGECGIASAGRGAGRRSAGRVLRRPGQSARHGRSFERLSPGAPAGIEEARHSPGEPRRRELHDGGSRSRRSRAGWPVALNHLAGGIRASQGRAGRLVWLGGSAAYPRHPRPRPRRGLPGNLGNQCGPDGERRAVVGGADPCRG